MAEIHNNMAVMFANASREAGITEMQGTALQPNWRPILKVTFSAIAPNLYFRAGPTTDPDISESSGSSGTSSK